MNLQFNRGQCLKMWFVKIQTTAQVSRANSRHHQQQINQREVLKIPITK
ncbi:MAG: hypothetical protein ACKVOU_11175 [Cytophagales bacterium]